MEKEREQQVYLARLAEQAERYDGIISMDLCLFFFFFHFEQNFDTIFCLIRRSVVLIRCFYAIIIHFDHYCLFDLLC